MEEDLVTPSPPMVYIVKDFKMNRYGSERKKRRIKKNMGFGSGSRRMKNTSRLNFHIFIIYKEIFNFNL
jgi:hypothetical protein